MAASCERNPRDTRVALDKDALWIREPLRRVVNLGQTGERWIGSWMNADNLSGILVGPHPHRAIEQAGRNTVRIHSNPFVFPRHQRLIGLDPARIRFPVP